MELCIVGGGMAGICAAISAARHGVKVALMQDRPVLGGNSSSEIRMWICGAHGENNRETGLLEEFQLENLYRNGSVSYSIWDSVLYEKVRYEQNILLLLNCTCVEAEMDGSSIKSIRGWQLTAETWHKIEADYFADCSGDSILGYLSGAEFRLGREAASEFNEKIEPEASDKKTMGMSCLFQIRETDRPQPFIPPIWAEKYLTDDELPFREHDKVTNFWWIELGGQEDSIHDTEVLRDRLLKIAFGIWDHMKNQGEHGVENWVLDWVGFLPGKRESRRLIGDYILNENDVESEGRFEDLVAYGGWSMDDHFPAGFEYKDGHPTIYHPAPSPFGIPYRCLYSKNIDNLFFAGRNISTTHAALSATRVMATCSLLGQAIGTAASICVDKKMTPREVYQHEIAVLKQTLMEDDAYLPWNERMLPELMKKATLRSSHGDAAALGNGWDRPIKDADNGWYGGPGDWVELSFSEEQHISEIRLVFDSNLNRGIHNMPCNYPLLQTDFHVPETMVRDFEIMILKPSGVWEKLQAVANNYQRLVRLNVDVDTKAVRFIPTASWGSSRYHVFSFQAG